MVVKIQNNKKLQKFCFGIIKKNTNQYGGKNTNLRLIITEYYFLDKTTNLRLILIKNTNLGVCACIIGIYVSNKYSSFFKNTNKNKSLNINIF